MLGTLQQSIHPLGKNIFHVDECVSRVRSDAHTILLAFRVPRTGGFLWAAQDVEEPRQRAMISMGYEQSASVTYQLEAESELYMFDYQKASWLYVWRIVYRSEDTGKRQEYRRT